MVERALGGLSATIGDNQAIELMRQAAGELNFFSTISVTPFGVPNLMAVRLPDSTPLGPPAVYPISGELVGLALLLGLTLAGLLVGGAYLGLIAQQVRDGAPSLRRLLSILPRYWVSILVLMIVLLPAGAVTAVPLLVVDTVPWSLWMLLVIAVSLVGFMLFTWLLFHLVFTAHGILLSEQRLLTAAWNSLRLVAFSSFSTMGLLALVVGINAGLNFVWGLPSDDSWMLLVGIVGHAVINSGLVAATFVFYQDRYRYWKELRAYFARLSESESLES